ncbi:TetR family transcriptional regulator [Prauserella sp. PE36]|uniref:TetR/AcrR family transcriptional regulator n=1 Tax=Prauserella endophytica TaxID=1592324 RepID=A0ABY2S3C5_9PSEU|nr:MULTISPECIES: TetR/AcrR family transcriptional regulator [Prauserella]RBM10332.1 TetR family transcriptional regulator [Prauserella sp. PE36]TKG68354.1 TetR/AcrR family transcriptional regulator [Prauserella endophytica]
MSIQLGSNQEPPKQERSAETRRQLLDAAADELLDGGFARFTTHGVARRAGISRGAQQHHFPHKHRLVTAAVHHLAERSLQQLEGITSDGSLNSTRRVLDALFEQYAGPLFAAMLDLSLAARADEQLRDAVQREEHTVNRMIDEWAHRRLTGCDDAPADFDELFAMAISTVRGVAVLRLLGHSQESVQRQWKYTRDQLLRLLVENRS